MKKRKKYLVKGIGHPCSWCSQPMERRTHIGHPKPNSYTEWDYCVPCQRIQQYENYRVIDSQPVPASKEKQVEFYTDGGCEWRNKCGAWSFVCLDPYTEVSGAISNTTSNRMELTAILEAIKFALEMGAKNIFIHSDSKYAVNSFMYWMENWVRENWVDKKNVDIFKELYRLKHTPTVEITIRWVRGHNGNEYNEAADQLVRSKYDEVFGGEMTY